MQQLPPPPLSRAAAAAAAEEQGSVAAKMEQLLHRFASEAERKHGGLATAEASDGNCAAAAAPSLESDVAFLRGAAMRPGADANEADADDYEKMSESTLLGVEQYNLKCQEIKVLSSTAVQDRLHRREFIIPQYRIGSLGGIALGAAFAVTFHITSIDIGHNGLGDSGIMAILDSLSRSTNCIRRLNMEANSAGPASTPSIASFIRSAKRHLKFLSIAHNQFHDACLRTVFEALISEAPEIEEIDLSYTGVGDPSAQLLCTLIETGSSLQSLGLAWNLLSNAWAPIFDAIAESKNLRILDVSFNRTICDKHINALADCLSRNTALKTLDVSGCWMHLCAGPVAEALRSNKALETLMLDELAAQAIAQHVQSTDDFKCQLAIRHNVVYTESDLEMTFDTDESSDADAPLHSSQQNGYSNNNSNSDSSNRRPPPIGANGSAKEPDGSSSSRAELLRDLAKELEQLARSNASEAGGESSSGAASSNANPEHGADALTNKQQQSGIGRVLRDLEESLTEAQVATRNNPRSVIALKAQMATSMVLEKWHTVAEQCIGAIQDAKIPLEADCFEQAVTMIRQRRRRYLGPRRRVRLRVKALRGLNQLQGVEEAPAEVEEIPLNAAYERLLQRVEDLVSLHACLPAERNSVREVFKQFDAIIRRLFRYYRDGEDGGEQGGGGGGGMGEDGGESSTVWEDPPEGVIRGRDVWRMMHDCQILTSSLGMAEVDRIVARCHLHDRQVEIGEKVVADGGRLMPEVADLHTGTAEVSFFDCYEMLIRAAWATHSAASPTLHGRLRSLIRTNLEPLACTDSRDRVKLQFQAGIADFNGVHKAKVLKIYRFFSTRKESKSSSSSSSISSPPSGGKSDEDGSGGKRGKPATDSASAGAGIDEGDRPMCFNDVLSFCQRLELFHPGLNPKKLAALVEATIGTGYELLPQVHANNAKVELIYEEFVELLGRMSGAAAGASAASAALKAKRFMEQLEKFLNDTIYPSASKVLPVRL